MAMTAWEILGSIGLDVSAFEAGLSQATETTKKAAATLESDSDAAVRRMEANFQRVGNSMIRVGAGLTAGIKVPMMAVAATITNATRQLGLYADSVLDASEQTGLTTDALQEFENVARTAGVNANALANAATSMTRMFRTTTMESAGFATALERLGVESRGADGELRDMNDILPEIMRNLALIENTTERNSMATQIFKGSAQELIPVLALGADEIDRLTAEAHEMGQVLSLDSLNAANDLRIGMEQMQARIRFAWREVSVSLVPVMTRLVNLFIDKAIPAVRRMTETIVGLVEWFENLAEWQQTALGGLAVALAASGPLLMGLGAVMTLVPQLATAFVALKAVMLAFTGPVGIFALIAGGIATYLLTSTARATDRLTLAKRASAEFRDALAGADDDESLMGAVTALAQQLDGEGQRALIEYSEQAIATADDIQVAKERIVRYYAEIAHADQIARIRLRIAQVDAEIAARAVEIDSLQAQRDDVAASLAEKRLELSEAEAAQVDLRQAMAAGALTSDERAAWSGLSNMIARLSREIEHLEGNVGNVTRGVSENTQEVIGGLVEARRAAEAELEAILTGAAREVESTLDVQARVVPARSGALHAPTEDDPLGVKDGEVEFKFEEGSIGRAIEVLEHAVDAARAALLSAAVDATDEVMEYLRGHLAALEDGLERVRTLALEGHGRAPMPSIAPTVPGWVLPDSLEVEQFSDAVKASVAEGVSDGLILGVGGFAPALAREVRDAMLGEGSLIREPRAIPPERFPAGVSQDDRRELDAQRQYDRDMARRSPVPAAPLAPLAPGVSPPEGLGGLDALGFRALPPLAPDLASDTEAWVAAADAAGEAYDLVGHRADISARSSAAYAEAQTRVAEAQHAVGEVSTEVLVAALENEEAKLQRVRAEVTHGSDEWVEYTLRLARTQGRLEQLAPEAENVAEATLDAANANVRYHRTLSELEAEHADYEGALLEQVAALEAVQATVQEGSEKWREYELAILGAKATLASLEGPPEETSDERSDRLATERAKQLREEQQARAGVIQGLTTMGADKGPLANFAAGVLGMAAQIPLVGAAIEGFVQAGPMGALVAVFTELLGRSEAFQRIMGKLNDILSPVVDMLDSLLTALEPIIDVAVALVDAALQPLALILENVVAPVFTFVAKLVAGIWNAIATAINRVLGWLGVNLRTIDLDGDAPATPGRLTELQERREGLQRELMDATSELEIARINREIAAVDAEIARIRALGLEGERSPVAPGLAAPRDVSFGGTPQAVQLAVATPLVQASSVMLDAATMMQTAFANLMPTTDGLGLGALPPFTSAIERMTPVLERLLSEGVSIMTGTSATGSGTAQTAYLRGI